MTRAPEEAIRLATVGHVEWVRFLRVNRAPQPGRVLRAHDAWDEPAGGGGVAAAEMARLIGHATLYTAVGTDVWGERVAPDLAQHGVDVVAVSRAEPHRQAVTLLDPEGERTIIVVGPAQSPCGGELELEAVDGLYFCKGDAAMLKQARAATSVLVATARVLPVLQAARVPVDALVFSANDASEHYTPGDLDPAPKLIAQTEGKEGGTWWTTVDDRQGRWRAAALSGPVTDAYGCGDSFAAALTFALARNHPVEEALRFAAERGAAALCRRGAHGEVASAMT